MRDVNGHDINQVHLAPRTGAILRLPGATAIVEIAAAIPHLSQIGPNYPNPFNSSTTLRYVVGTSGIVDLSVCDLTGQLVRQLVSRNQREGSYELVWDGTNTRGQAVASGVYVIRLQIGSSFAGSRKLMLVQ